MEFKSVKTKLNILYTGSLLMILIIFIIVLYFFISGAVKKQEIEQLKRFYEEEKHEFIEEIYESAAAWPGTYEAEERKKDKHKKDRAHHEYDGVEYKPERGMFYYVFDNSHQLVKGEETVNGFVQYLHREALHTHSGTFMKEVEWRKAHVLFIAYPLHERHQTIGSVIIGMDITDEKHLLQTIIWILLLLTLLFSLLFAWAGNFFAGQAMKPIQRAFETQRTFVSDASHELRTPLSIFYSSIDVLAREEWENLSPFGRQVLEDVKNESEMMNELLNDLLFLARYDQGHFELETEELDLSFQIKSLLHRFKRAMPAHLTLEEKIQSGIRMKGDKVRIQQLMYILLDNAVRHTSAGSITCSLTTQGQSIVISIKDTGCGIAEKDIAHIFDRFYRGDTARKRDGSGLGLSIAKTIVEAHGGNIEVKSEVGKGAEFIIRFDQR